jgi:hypothetical protein
MVDALSYSSCDNPSPECLPYIKLTEEEAQAIIYHDGQYVEDNASVAAKEAPLTLLLQYADSWSGFVVEK